MTSKTIQSQATQDGQFLPHLSVSNFNKVYAPQKPRIAVAKKINAKMITTHCQTPAR